MRRTAMVALALALAACGRGQNPGLVTLRLVVGSSPLEIRVEVAATAEARRIGLMKRPSLAAGRGMLFLFPGNPARRSFWMRETLIPLDIAFIRDGRVTEIASMVPCSADPCPTTVSGEPADSALEVPAGTFEQAGIVAGALVQALTALPPAS